MPITGAAVRLVPRYWVGAILFVWIPPGKKAQPGTIAQYVTAGTKYQGTICRVAVLHQFGEQGPHGQHPEKRRGKCGYPFQKRAVPCTDEGRSIRYANNTAGNQGNQDQAILFPYAAQQNSES